MELGESTNSGTLDAAHNFHGHYLKHGFRREGDHPNCSRNFGPSSGVECLSNRLAVKKTGPVFPVFLLSSIMFLSSIPSNGRSFSTFFTLPET